MKKPKPSWLEMKLRDPGFRREFNKASVQLVLDDLRWSLKAERRKRRERERRIRLMLQCARAGAGVIELSDGDWYVSDLANLRRALPGRRK